MYRNSFSIFLVSSSPKRFGACTFISVTLALSFFLLHSTSQPSQILSSQKNVLTVRRSQTATFSLLQRFDVLVALRQQLLAREARLFAALGTSEASAHTRNFGSVNEEQILLYLEFAAALAPNASICEVGFFNGVSATTMLTAAPVSATYNVFDIDFKPSQLEAVKLLFGSSRVNAHPGDSRISVARFDGTCNLIHIDGGHDEETAASDIDNFKKKSVCSDNVVLLDDTFNCPDFETENYCSDASGGNCRSCNCFEKGYCNGASRAYWKAVSRGLIAHKICFPTGNDGVYMKGFCVGKYLC